MSFAELVSLIESLVVIVSVLFIWWEIRENRKLTKVSNTQALVELSSPFNLQLIQDRKMAEYWVLGPEMYDDMDEVEKYRYISLLTWWLILHENIFYQHKNNLLDTEVYRGWNNDLQDFARKHRLWLHWNDVKLNYKLEFSKHVSQIVDELKRSFDAVNNAQITT